MYFSTAKKKKHPALAEIQVWGHDTVTAITASCQQSAWLETRFLLKKIHASTIALLAEKQNSRQNASASLALNGYFW